METLCTIIGINPEFARDRLVETSVPLKEAIDYADRNPGKWPVLRVYAETNNGATLSLIYSRTP